MMSYPFAEQKPIIVPHHTTKKPACCTSIYGTVPISAPKIAPTEPSAILPFLFSSAAFAAEVDSSFIQLLCIGITVILQIVTQLCHNANTI